MAQDSAFRPGDRLPPMIGVVARNVIDGMRVWGRVDNGQIKLDLYGSLVDEGARTVSFGGVRVDVISPVDGPTFLLFEQEDVVLVELAP